MKLHQSVEQRVLGDFDLAPGDDIVGNAGVGNGPGPLKVEADKLKSVLGVRQVDFVPGKPLAVSDSTLA